MPQEVRRAPARSLPVPVLDAAAPNAAPADAGAALRGEVDEHGDAVFRFHLEPLPDAASLSLADVYERSVRDLLAIVRFYHRGRPVLVDAFAFRNAPGERISLTGDERRPG